MSPATSQAAALPGDSPRSQQWKVMTALLVTVAFVLAVVPSQVVDGSRLAGGLLPSAECVRVQL
jgi:hypothetical protein